VSYSVCNSSKIVENHHIVLLKDGWIHYSRW